MYRNNPLHTGVAADVVLPPLKLKWKQTFGDKIDSSPAIFGSRLYVGSVDKNLYAIDTATGNIIWSFNDGASYFGLVFLPRRSNRRRTDGHIRGKR